MVTVRQSGPAYFLAGSKMKPSASGAAIKLWNMRILRGQDVNHEAPRFVILQRGIASAALIVRNVPRQPAAAAFRINPFTRSAGTCLVAVRMQ